MPYITPYQYPEIRSPLAGTITDIMQRQGDPYARAAIATGEAQARAQEIGGQAWAGAAQGIGNAAANTIQTVTDPRRQLEQQQVTQAKQNVAGQAAVNQIVSQLTTQNPDGSRTLDRGKLAQSFAARNIPLAIQQQTFKALDDVDSSIKTFQQAKTDHMADLAHGILTAPGGATPTNVQMGAALAKANNLATDEQLAPLLAASDAGQDLTPTLTMMRGMSEKYKDLSKPVVLPRPGASAINPASGAIIATAPQGPERPITVAPGSTAISPSTGQVIYQAPAKATDKSLQRASVLLDGKPAEVLMDPDPASKQPVLDLNRQPIENAAARIKPIPPASVTVQNNLQRDLAQPDNPVIKAMAEYRVPPPSPRTMATAAGQSMMAAVTALNPSYDATQFPNRQKTRIAFTTGTQGQQINAMNTAIGHLDQVADVAKDLGNSDVQVANRAKNWFSTQFGGANVTNFNTVKTVLAGELASVFKKSGATDAEIKSVESTINAANSPDQLKGYVDQVVPLLGSKLSSLNYQYHQAMGENDPFQALSPDAKGILVKHGFDPEHPTLKGNTQGPAEGTEGVVNGVAAVWKTVNGKTGWYRK